jgi:hypothetical protein
MSGLADDPSRTSRATHRVAMPTVMSPNPAGTAKSAGSFPSSIAITNTILLPGTSAATAAAVEHLGRSALA